MKSRNTLVTLAVPITVLAVLAAAQPANAGEESAIVVAESINARINTENARAIVLARLPNERPDDGTTWQCRLIHSGPIFETDPDFTKDAAYVRRIEPGAVLVLVNLTDQHARFKFTGNLFVEQGSAFVLGPDGVKILTVKENIEVAPKDPSSGFKVKAYPVPSVDEDGNPIAACKDDLPGPVILIP